MKLVYLRPSGTPRKKNQILKIAYLCRFLDCILGKYQPRQLIRLLLYKIKKKIPPFQRLTSAASRTTLRVFFYQRFS